MPAAPGRRPAHSLTDPGRRPASSPRRSRAGPGPDGDRPRPRRVRRGPPERHRVRDSPLPDRLQERLADRRVRLRGAERQNALLEPDVRSKGAQRSNGRPRRRRARTRRGGAHLAPRSRGRSSGSLQLEGEGRAIWNGDELAYGFRLGAPDLDLVASGGSEGKLERAVRSRPGEVRGGDAVNAKGSALRIADLDDRIGTHGEQVEIQTLARAQIVDL